MDKMHDNIFNNNEKFDSMIKKRNSNYVTLLGAKFENENESKNMFRLHKSLEGSRFYTTLVETQRRKKSRRRRMLHNNLDTISNSFST